MKYCLYCNFKLNLFKQYIATIFLMVKFWQPQQPFFTVKITFLLLVIFVPRCFLFFI